MGTVGMVDPTALHAPGTIVTLLQRPCARPAGGRSRDVLRLVAGLVAVAAEGEDCAPGVVGMS